MAGEQFIQRGRHKSGFAVLPNKIWEDEKLSVEAKGTLGYLLSRPANWRVRLAHVARKLGIGRDRLYRIINECIAAGYVERRQGRQSGSFKPVSYFVNDVASLPHTDLPEAAQPDAAQPEAANQDALTRKNSNKGDSKQTTSAKPSPPPRTPAREGNEIAAEVLASLPVSARAHPGWRGFGAWIDQHLTDGAERADVVVGAFQCLHSLGDQPPKSFAYFAPAIARAREARTRPLPQAGVMLPERPHKLGPAGDQLRKRLGNDVFASWFNQASIIDTCGDTVTIAVATKFIRSRIIADFEVTCLEAFRASDPSIARVVVTVAGAAP